MLLVRIHVCSLPVCLFVCFSLLYCTDAVWKASRQALSFLGNPLGLCFVQYLFCLFRVAEDHRPSALDLILLSWQEVAETWPKKSNANTALHIQVGHKHTTDLWLDHQTATQAMNMYLIRLFAYIYIQKWICIWLDYLHIFTYKNEYVFD